MSGENNSPTGNPSEMMRHWFEMASEATAACQKWAVNQVSPDTMRQTRANVLKMWSEYWEQLLRSSSFLDAEKQCMSGNLEYRKQMHEFLGQLHHEMQLATAQDIDQLTRTLRRMGEDQQEQCEQICQRLDKLATQVDALAQRLGGVENSPRPTTPARPDLHIRRKPNAKHRNAQRRR
jgi:hypothetical protein